MFFIEPFLLEASEGDLGKTARQGYDSNITTFMVFDSIEVSPAVD